jgi:glucose uptake protein
MAILYAFVTVLAWGAWLAPSQGVSFRGQQVRTFYVAAANLAIAFLVAAAQGFGKMTADVFWLPFGGGIIWALGAWAAFTATEKLGLVRAFGIWAPLNIVVSVAFGATLFREYASFGPHTIAVLIASLALIIGGVVMIIYSKGAGEGNANKRVSVPGLACAVVAGVLWAAYYLPIKISHASMWVAAFPMACGMFAGCSAIVLSARQSPRLPQGTSYVRALLSGSLWALGNYGMLLMVQTLGAGRGFTISQLAVVVNALCGIYLLRDPAPHTRSAHLTLIGCVIATIGAISLGSLK